MRNELKKIKVVLVSSFTLVTFMHTNIAELSDIYLFYILEIFRRNMRKYVQ